jgi:hypothetical protein
VQQIGRLSLARSGREANILVGDSVAAPASLPRDQTLTVKTPNGEPVSAAPGAALMERAEHSGFYEVSSPTEGLLHGFVVNTDGRESQLAPLAGEALEKIVSHESVAGLDALRLWLARSHGLVPLWPLLLLVAVGVFFVESIYSNLLARRRAQGDEEHIKTGRLNKRRLGQPFRAGPEAAPAEEEVGA